MKLPVRPMLQVTVLCLMVICFLVQMWEQFDKFLKQQTTVAVSFENRKGQKFPTFAFCDSRAIPRYCLQQLQHDAMRPPLMWRGRLF